MLGDLRVLDTGEELLLDTERVALQELFNTIRRFRIGFEVELHKRTVERGLLSLLGPESAAVAGASDLADAEHSHAALEARRDPGPGDSHRPGRSTCCATRPTPIRSARRSRRAAR